MKVYIDYINSENQREKCLCDVNKITLKEAAVGISLIGSQNSIYFGFNKIRQFECFERETFINETLKGFTEYVMEKVVEHGTSKKNPESTEGSATVFK